MILTVLFGHGHLDLAAYESFLGQGVLHGRRLFQILTATEDKAEGMKAFIEKRDGQWKGR